VIIAASLVDVVSLIEDESKIQVRSTLHLIPFSIFYVTFGPVGVQEAMKEIIRNSK
jgi:hypothetical protein